MSEMQSLRESPNAGTSPGDLVFSGDVTKKMFVIIASKGMQSERCWLQLSERSSELKIINHEF